MYHIIVNTASGSGAGSRIWDQLHTFLDENEIKYHVHFTEYEGHASEIAADLSECRRSSGEQAEQTPFDENHVVILGGDGTVNEFINGIRDFERIRLGVIPTGSGNDFVKGLGMPADWEEALLKIFGDSPHLSGKTEEGKKDRRIDLGQISYRDGHRYFAISSGIGLDAIVCKKALDSRLKDILNKLHLGRLTYLILTVQTLFSMETAKVQIIFPDGKKKRMRKMIFAAAMNLPAEGGGVPMAPSALPEDGKLSLCIAAGVPKWKTFFLLPFLVLAKHEKLRGFYLEDFRECRIRTDKPMVVHADGEYIGTLQDICYRCVPEKLKIIDLKGEEQDEKIM